MRRRGWCLAGLIAALALGCDDGGGGSADPADGGSGGVGGSGGEGGLGGDGGAGGDGGRGGDGPGGAGGGGGGGPIDATLCDVIDTVFEPTCVGCHNGSIDPLDLRSVGLADRIIDMPGLTYPGYQLVVPGDAEASLLYQKAAGTQPADAGGRMPPAGMVSADQLAVLRGWIDGGAGTECDAPEPAEIVPLTAVERAARVSMAVRGVRPSLAELEAVQADPDALDGLVDTWLDSPAFAQTLKDMHDAQMKVRAQSSLLFPPIGALGDLPEQAQQVNAINKAVMEAPLELVADVVMNDRPYTEILTAEWMPATVTERLFFGEEVEVRGVRLGLECEDAPIEGRPELTRCRWLERGRGGAGILSSGAFLLRWQSAAGNLHRGRANAVSNAFLCYDFLSNDVSLDGLDIDFADPDVVANAVQEVPACATCHDALDPLASFFFGYRGRILINQLGDEPYPLLMFNPGNAYQPGQMLRNGRTPALFGQAGTTLADLGRMITEHPDFASCTVRRFHSYLSQTGMDALDDAQLTAWSAAFVDSGHDAKALVKRIVLSDAFAASHTETEVGADDVVGLKKVRPEQAARAVEALTGLQWRTFLPFRIGNGTYGDVELPLNSLVGYKVLAGGTDNVSVLTGADTYNAPTAAFWSAFAAEAAGEVVDADFARPANQRLLLRGVEPETRNPETIRRQLVGLHLVLLGETLTPDDPAINDTLTLLADAAERNADPAHAWKVVLTAMFQDARFTHY